MQMPQRDSALPLRERGSPVRIDSPNSSSGFVDISKPCTPSRTSDRPLRAQASRGNGDEHSRGMLVPRDYRRRSALVIQPYIHPYDTHLIQLEGCGVGIACFVCMHTRPASAKESEGRVWEGAHHDILQAAWVAAAA